MNDIALNFDTIAAIATPLGRGGIGILRLSGPNAVTISQQLVRGDVPKPRLASYREFIDLEGISIDKGIVLYFKQPNSFTGEDVIELQGHGSPYALQALLDSALLAGARLAKPGEFSERAFLNNRIDLAQAEAIADLIHASSEKAAKAAMASLQGVFSQKVAVINQTLIQLRTAIEAAIDFSEEAIDLSLEAEVILRIQNLVERLQTLQIETKAGQRLQEGISIIVLGPPNAGKSSLLNALSDEEVAIVDQTVGTTRDILRANIVLDGLSVHVMDTAGLHETDNGVEQKGIQRALDAIELADQIIWVVDSTQPMSLKNPTDILASFSKQAIKLPIAIVRNKVDLSREPIGVLNEAGYDVIRLSATTKEGLGELKTYLKEQVGYNSEQIGFSARERHTVALKRAEVVLTEGLKAFEAEKAIEILAFYLHEAHRIIGEITGVFTTEDLLGRIFSEFCIGK